MILPLSLLALCFLQDSGLRVVALVEEAHYVEALAVAEEADSSEGAWLQTWIRHQGGDLSGALVCAREGLVSAPDDVRLLEQAAYIANSLMLANEGLGYSERLLALGEERGAAQHDDAQQLVREQSLVSVSLRLSWAVIGAACALLLMVFRYALSPLEAPAA